MQAKVQWKVFILSAVVMMSGIFGCKNWEHDIVKNGIHFKKISQSKKGTIVGYMSENQTIQGFPCEKGWIHFRENWDLLSFQLSETFMFKANVLPAKTWIHFPYQKDRTGFVCSFPEDIEVQGYLCDGSGGYKGTHTGFYESGRLRSFFAPKDVMADGVPCESSLLVNVNLHENGRIKSCKLSRDYESNGTMYRKGQTLRLDEAGHVLP